MLVPLYAFLRGDSLGLLLLVQDSDTIAEVAESAQQAAAVRVANTGTGRVLTGGRELPPALTVAQAGLAALDRIDVVSGSD
jgi:hypothetical protein